MDENIQKENIEKNTQEDIEEVRKKCYEHFLMLQRVSADFENFKKRTNKDKETIYQTALAEVISTFLPILDNFERAFTFQGSDSNESFRMGISFLFKQFKECFEKLGVKEIKALGEKFDPEIHNAILHVEDENYGENEIIEEFQKGYILFDKIIRHSVVKVAN